MINSEIILLGTGNAESLNFWNTNALVRTNGKNFLIDCGYTIKYALNELGMSLSDIDAVYITHIHGDHVFGLERLGFESRYLFKKRVKLYLEPEFYPLLWNECLKGSLKNTSNGINSIEDFFDIVIIKDRIFEFEGTQFKSFKTLHTPGKDSFGLTINDRVMFTSDTNVISSIVETFNGDLIIHDCSLKKDSPAHATITELLDTYPLKMRKKMLLIHYDDDIDLCRNVLEKEFMGIAKQGQVISI